MAGTRRVVIVGAGVTGLLTAIECALAGHRVTVLDRGPIPNPESSSFDQHRAIRTLDPGDPAATRRMVAAERRWRELEALLGTRFYRRVGVLTAWPRERIDAVTAFAARVAVSVETVPPEKLPHLGLPAGSTGVLEVDAGVLLAERVLGAATGWLAGRPEVTLWPWSEVTAVDIRSGRVVLADGATLDGDLILIAAGPSGTDLVELPVVTHRQTMVYLRPPENLARWWENAPAAGGLGADRKAWLLPPGDGTLLKISSDTVSRPVSRVDGADENQSRWVDELLTASIVTDVDQYEMVAARSCHYITERGTGGSLLTRVGPAVWSRAACGGSGFSSAPLVASRIVHATMEEAA